MTGSNKLKRSEQITGTRFVRRMYLMRMLGTLLCFFPILSVLLEHHQPRWLIALLAVKNTASIVAPAFACRQP